MKDRSAAIAWARHWAGAMLKASLEARRVPWMPWKPTGTAKRLRHGYREARAGRMLKRFR